MMKEMIRKVMEWCKLWNGETATAKQADPSSDKREKEQAADNREVQDRLENYLWKHYVESRESFTLLNQRTLYINIRAKSNPSRSIRLIGLFPQ